MSEVTAKELFEYEKKRGEIVEKELLKRIKKKYPKAHKKDGSFKWYDIYIPEKDIRLEVKYDARSEETHRFFIEYEFEGEPAGIDVTTSDYYVIADMNYFYMITTEWLKFIVKDRGAYKKTFTNKAGLLTKGYLIDRQWVISAIQLNPKVGKIFKR